MSPVAGKITALMTAACMENNNNSGTISVKADIFAPGGRGDGGRKAELKPIRRFLIFGRISGEIGIASPSLAHGQRGRA